MAAYLADGTENHQQTTEEEVGTDIRGTSV